MFHSCCMPPILCVYPIDGPLWRRRAYTRHSNVPTLNVSCMPGFDVDFISYETKKKREKKKNSYDWTGAVCCFADLFAMAGRFFIVMCIIRFYIQYNMYWSTRFIYERINILRDCVQFQALFDPFCILLVSWAQITHVREWLLAGMEIVYKCTSCGWCSRMWRQRHKAQKANRIELGDSQKTISCRIAT